jgi:hypothetical protein
VTLTPHPLALLTLAIGLAPSAARADRRYYGETYNQTTSAPGGVDIEPWTTLVQPRASSGERQFWQHQLELETGITSRWDVALYNVFQYVQGDTFKYQATKVETRYRLSDYGEWFVDPVLYFEARKEWIEDKPWALEGKLIVAKDIGPLNVSLNGLYEIEFPSGGGREHELGYAAGASYELAPWVRVGGEAFGAWTRGAEGGPWVDAHYAGPALSFAWSRTWLVLAAGFGINDAAAKQQLRAIFSLQL